MVQRKFGCIPSLISLILVILRINVAYACDRDQRHPFWKAEDTFLIGNKEVSNIRKIFRRRSDHIGDKSNQRHPVLLRKNDCAVNCAPLAIKLRWIKSFASRPDRREDYSAPPTSIQPHKQSVSTDMGHLYRMFETVCTTEDIDMEKLVAALAHIALEMKRVGQIQAAKEMQSNLHKIRQAYQKIDREQRKTVRSILLCEKKMLDIRHPPLPDPSIAIALLWIRRSIAFQYRLYSLILEGDCLPAEASMQAYIDELEPYHKWTLRNVYRLALPAFSPSTADEMLQKLSGHERFGASERDAVIKDMKQLLDVWKPLLRRWKQIYVELHLEDTRRV